MVTKLSPSVIASVRELYVLGYSTREIMETLDIPEVTVDSALENRFTQSRSPKDDGHPYDGLFHVERARYLAERKVIP